MSWNQLTLDIPDDLKDAVVGELSAQGATGVWESGEAGPDCIRVIAYFDSAADITRIDDSIRAIFDRVDCPYPRIARGVVADRDWNEEWKKSYASFDIGRRFFVIPSWSGDSSPEGRLPILIDPGQAFGTGTHETTQLTLEALERWVKPDQVVFDLGTGSGILAIACRMLGTASVFAADNDPVAIQVARENIERNVSRGIPIMCGSIDAIRPGCLDVLLCNLTADLIVSLFPDIYRSLRKGGLAIFSGILNTQRDEIFDVMSRFGFILHQETAKGEWLAFVVQKHVS
jgi:ribosomal protein L11 methyltransferase